MFTDAEGHPDRYDHLPDWLLPLHLQTSKPDIVIVTNAHLHNLHDRTTPLSMAEQRCHTVRIVEVKCTYAFNFEEKIRQARDQHDLLSANFLAAGWPVERFEIVLDHTGIVSNLTVGALAALGLPTSERAILIRQLQCLCIRSAFSMHTTRIALLHAYTSDPSSPVPYYDGVT